MDQNLKQEEKKLDQIRGLLRATESNLEKISLIIEKIEQEEKKEYYKQLPGVEGTFDGFNLVLEDNSKIEVPSNYAAKSRLVFGDKLKVVEEDGKKVFKQIEKVDRKLISGILSKKEGKWYILSDSGSYRISDIAAEFNKAELNEEAEAFLPVNNLNAPYAALDKIIRKEEKPRPTEMTTKPEKLEEKPKIEKKELPVNDSKDTKDDRDVKDVKVIKEVKDNRNVKNNRNVKAKPAPAAPKAPQKPPFIRKGPSPATVAPKPVTSVVEEEAKTQPLILEEDDLR